jgi:hypothetical protein
MKVFKYFDFLLEAARVQKTMRLHYSEKFRSLLKKMQKTNEFAALLLGAEDSNQISDIYTLIDVTEKNDMISCIQVNRILRANPDTKTYTDSDVYFLNRTITNDETNEFWKNARTEMGIGKWLRRVVIDLYKSPSVLNDKKLEDFVNLYKSTFDSLSGAKEERFQLVEGEEIRKWYLADNYFQQKGQLGNSCMRYTRCQPYLDIYVKNPEVCKLLIYKSEEDPEKIIGRAVIWKINSNPRGITRYMDRVYTVADSDRLLFQDWATENGVNYGYSGVKSIQLQNSVFDKYPYMDSFIYLNRETGDLTNNDDVWPGQGYIKIQDTNGGFSDDDGVWSEYHGDYINRDDAVYCDYTDDWIHVDDAIYLEYKDIYVSPNNDTAYSEYHGETFLTDDAVWSECMNDNLYPEYPNVVEMKTSYSGDTDWVIATRTDLCVKVGEEYYSKKDYIKDPYSDEYHFLDEKEMKTSEDRFKESWGDKLYHKLLEDIIPMEKREEDFQLLRKWVIDEIKKDILNGEYDIHLISEIENNEIFRRSIHGVYWGFDKEDKPTAEDLVQLIVACKIEPVKLRGYVSTIELRKLHTMSTEMINPEDKDLLRKYKQYNSTSFISTVNRLAMSISPVSFGNDLYKKFLFINS